MPRKKTKRTRKTARKVRKARKKRRGAVSPAARARRRGSRRPAKKRLQSRRVRTEVAYSANRNFPFFREVQSLVLKASPVSSPEIVKEIRRAGRMKFVLISGVFFGFGDARVDLLVVGDNIKLAKLFAFIKKYETELGKEIRYVVLSPAEFSYRYEMFDRFIRDILEAPHQKVINLLRIK